METLDPDPGGKVEGRENPCSDAVGWEQRPGEELLDNGREVRAAQGELAPGQAWRGTKVLATSHVEVAPGRDRVSHRLGDAVKDQDAKYTRDLTRAGPDTPRVLTHQSATSQPGSRTRPCSEPLPAASLTRRPSAPAQFAGPPHRPPARASCRQHGSLVCPAAQQLPTGLLAGS